MSRLLHSLHVRVLAWLLMLLIAVWVAIWLGARHTASNTATRDIDTRLRITAQNLVQLSAASRARPRSDAESVADRTAPVTARTTGSAARLPDFEVVTDDDRLIARSDGFPSAARDTRPGFDRRTADDSIWRIYTLVDDRSGLTCRVATDDAARQARSRVLDARFDGVLFWLAPLLVLAVVATLWRGLAPLRRLERAIAGQDPAQLGPLDLDPTEVPSELRSLVVTLDRLFARLRDVLARQRAFTAAAGHELRTPLAGCRTQLEVARKSGDETGRSRALGHVERSIKRLTRVVDQLLMLARIDPAAPEISHESVDVGALVSAVLAARETRRSRAVALSYDPPVSRAFVRGDADLLESMLANLLDNAIRFSPDGGDVRVTVTTAAGEVALSVRDHGPGIAAHERGRVFEQFYRSSEKAGGGSGLGLTIVREIVDLHRGAIDLEAADGGGTHVRIRLPKTAPGR